MDSFNVQPLFLVNLPYPMIAPLWADFNFRDQGTIYYRVTNDSKTLSEIVERIARHNSNYAEYVPTEAVIVTWFQSRLFESRNMVS